MPRPELHQSIALVTGASRGIGRATALALAAEGESVVTMLFAARLPATAVATEIVLHPQRRQLRAPPVVAPTAASHHVSVALCVVLAPRLRRPTLKNSPRARPRFPDPMTGGVQSP